MYKSETISKLAVALVKAQSQIEHAKKGSKNPYFKSNYADLTEVIETIKKPLNENGIVFLQIVDSNESGSAVIETTLMHESGEFISGRTPVFCAKPNDPQALGSGITYSKRYGLQAICGLATEDDDGESAMGRNSNTKQKKSNQDLTLRSKVDAVLKASDNAPALKARMLKFVGVDQSQTLDILDDAQLVKILGAVKK